MFGYVRMRHFATKFLSQLKHVRNYPSQLRTRTASVVIIPIKLLTTRHEITISHPHDHQFWYLIRFPRMKISTMSFYHGRKSFLGSSISCNWKVRLPLPHQSPASSWPRFCNYCSQCSELTDVQSYLMTFWIVDDRLQIFDRFLRFLHAFPARSEWECLVMHVTGVSQMRVFVCRKRHLESLMDPRLWWRDFQTWLTSHQHTFWTVLVPVFHKGSCENMFNWSMHNVLMGSMTFELSR